MLNELIVRLQREMGAPPPSRPICQGTLLSREQYLFDVQRREQRDARIEHGHIRPEHCDIWTAAIGATTKVPEAAKSLIQFLTGLVARLVFTAKGFQPG